MRRNNLLRVRIFSESGIPLFFYNVQQDKIEREIMATSTILQHSSALTAILQGEGIAEDEVRCIQTDKEKHVLGKHETILVDLVFPGSIDATSKKIKQLVTDILEGIERIHEAQHFDPLEAVKTNNYIEQIGHQLRKLIKRLIISVNEG